MSCSSISPSFWLKITPFLNHRLQANLIIEIGCNALVDKGYRGLNWYYETGPKAGAVPRGKLRVGGKQYPEARGLIYDSMD